MFDEIDALRKAGAALADAVRAYLYEYDNVSHAAAQAVTRGRMRTAQKEMDILLQEPLQHEPDGEGSGKP